MGLLTIIKNNMEGFKDGYKHGYMAEKSKEATCDIKEVEEKTDVDDLKDEFFMIIEDVFEGKRGTICAGIIQSGSVLIGTLLTLKKENGETKTIEVIEICHKREQLSEASAGDEVLLLVSELTRREAQRGDILQSYSEKRNLDAAKENEIDLGMGKDEKYSVELTETGPNKPKVIKIIREITNLGLKEAKDLVDSTPSVIIEITDKMTANNVKTMIEAEGAKVTLNNLVLEPKETSAVEVEVCPICKNRIDEDTKVCPYCGHMFI